MTNPSLAQERDQRNEDRLSQQVPLDAVSGIPLHVQLRQGLSKLLDNDFSAGSQFYTERELVKSLKVSRITVRRALEDLTREGRLIRNSGRSGTTVRVFPGTTRGVGAENPETQQTRHAPVRRSVSMLFQAWESEAQYASLGHFSSACHRAGLDLKLHALHQGEDPASLLTQIAGGAAEDMFVLNLGSDINSRVHSRLAERGCRTVTTDAMPDSYPGDVVATDASAAVRIGLDHLFSLGHERIVLLVNEPIRDKSVVDKVDEFLSVMSRRGLALSGRVVVCGTHAWESSYEAAYQHMPEVWPDSPTLKPTAIFTVSDPGAWAAMKWLREHGVAVPENASVIGFENAASSAYVTPALTTVAHPLAEQAALCIELLTQEASRERRFHHLPPVLIVRDSTGPVPAA